MFGVCRESSYSQPNFAGKYNVNGVSRICRRDLYAFPLQKEIIGTDQEY